ncbi:hypothetical protein GY45DRAFT_1245159 [Cubamyces sp. BRFM 1775]|nr:hypothetical protein GY45DRAFT_1245159 [Cubamyces sp. BRFM 1775]
MEMSRHSTISAMMGTCRALCYAPQCSWLLLRNGVALQLDIQITSFLRFMLANPATRFKHLRALTFANGGFSGEAVDALRIMFAHPLFTIDTLVLHDAEAVLSSGVPMVEGPNDRWTCADAPLFDSFARLTALKHLTIDELGVRACTLLKKLPSSLVFASIEFGSASPRWNRLVGSGNYNPIVTLAHSVDTLEVLKGFPFSSPLPNVITYNIVYPRVRRLEIGFVEDWMRGVVTYAHAYPNLEHLRIVALAGHNSSDDYFITNPFLCAELERRRQHNKEAQVSHGSWKSLSVLEGGVSAVYALGLACKVSELRVAGIVEKKTVHYLGGVLSDVQPETLSVTVASGVMFDEGSTISQILAAPYVQCITSLEMDVLFADSEGDYDMEEMTNNILKSMSGLLSLRRLILVLDYAFLTSPYDSPESWSPNSAGSQTRYYCPAARYLSELDLEAYAGRFREAIPTLVEVLIWCRDNCTYDEAEAEETC